VKPVFADTFFWTALTSTGEAGHEQAVAFAHTLRTAKTITTEDVLDDVRPVWSFIGLVLTRAIV